MKKNKMMRLAAVILVLTLLSTSVISGTFAKYVTEGSANDSARVAKFGVTATVTGDAFKTEYAKEDANYSVTANSVVSSTSDKLVAPGTEGTFGGVTLSGTPEVAVRVSYEGSNVDLTGWTLASGYYCPILFNINGTEINGLAYDSETALETALLNAVTKGAGDYAPNTDLSTIDALNGTYTWAWAFEGAAGSAQTDAKDTELGNMAARGSASTITFDVTCTVTQID